MCWLFACNTAADNLFLMLAIKVLVVKKGLEKNKIDRRHKRRYMSRMEQLASALDARTETKSVDDGISLRVFICMYVCRSSYVCMYVCMHVCVCM